MDAMQQKYGETPVNDGTRITRAQLESFYGKHDPSVVKLGQAAASWKPTLPTSSRHSIRRSAEGRQCQSLQLLVLQPRRLGLFSLAALGAADAAARRVYRVACCSRGCLLADIGAAGVPVDPKPPPFPRKREADATYYQS
jgi:hypothetical protein